MKVQATLGVIVALVIGYFYGEKRYRKGGHDTRKEVCVGLNRLVEDCRKITSEKEEETYIN